MRETLPSWMYRNPEEVLERKQETELRKSCAGCVHAIEYEFKYSKQKICDKGKSYGRRCKLYQSLVKKEQI